MLKRHICSCYDGFSGKYCDYCEGKIIDDKCVEVDNVNDYLIDNSNSENVVNENINKENKYNVKKDEIKVITENKINENKINENKNNEVDPCGKWFNGICDYRVGKCICDNGWTGKNCDELIKKVEYNKFINESQKKWNINYSTILNWLFRLFGALIIVIILIYVFRGILKGKTDLINKLDYNVLGQSEDELGNQNSINDEDNNKLELTPND